MQFMTDAEFAGRLLEESERNLKIACHIQAARRHVLAMAAALVLTACAVLSEAGPVDVTLAIAGFVLGYSVRALISHLRRARRRR